MPCLLCISQGFVDPHVHLIFGGLSLSQVNLRGASSRAEVAARVAAAAAAAADGTWLLGGGWSESDWGGQLPDASWLDEVRRRRRYNSNKVTTRTGRVT
jgi:predicted amidohydrolase YtcJ